MPGGSSASFGWQGVPAEGLTPGVRQRRRPAGIRLGERDVRACTVSPDVRSRWLLTLISLPLAAICAWLSSSLTVEPTLTRKRLVLATVDRLWAAVPKLGRP